MAAVPPGCDPTSIVLTFDVAPEQSGLRLDRFLQIRIPRLSRTKATRIARACAYWPDGRKRRASDRVRARETVLIVRPAMKEPRAPLFYDKLYEDDDLLVVCKPSGLPMHPSATYHRHTLDKLLEKEYGENRPIFCHRLDRETSGVVVCAKRLAVEVAVKDAFADRKIKKGYVAMTRGRLPEREGTINLSMSAATGGVHVLMEIREDGLLARTHYRVIEEKEGASFVELSPETGRQHQLRLHLSALGAPIIGDKLYGPEGTAAFVEAFDVGLSHDLLVRLGHPRHALHAAWLSMQHPVTGEEFEFHAPLPWDLERLWQAPGEVLAGEPCCTWDDLYVRQPGDETSLADVEDVGVLDESDELFGLL